MNNIKLRAWHKKYKIMKLVGNIANLEDPVNCFISVGYVGTNKKGELVPCNWLLEECELMQWTGLQDKDGNDIYEGDILAADAGCDVHRLRVVYDNIQEGRWEVHKYVKKSKWELRAAKLDFHGIQKNQFAIVGNIYEHAHLLENNNEEKTPD